MTARVFASTQAVSQAAGSGATRGGLDAGPQNGLCMKYGT
jgi:hypothetical protein